MRSFRRAFTMADMMTAIVLCVLVLFYANAMIGCGGGEKDGKAAVEDLKKATQSLQTATGELEKATKELKTVADQVRETSEVFEPIAEQIRRTSPAPSPRAKAKANDADSKDPSVRANARRMQNSTHTRGIHSGMVLFAQGNKDFYPGLDSNGKKVTVPIPPTAGIMGYNTADGSHVGYRMAVLLRWNFLSPDYFISPLETNPAIKPLGLGRGESGFLEIKDGASYSYAMLSLGDLKAPRTREWRMTNNSRAPIITDRNIGVENTGPRAQSLHTRPGEGWIGSVCYNDNHAVFETSDKIKTEYALQGEIAQDRLFADTDKTSEGNLDADAAMVFDSRNNYVRQGAVAP